MLTAIPQAGTLVPLHQRQPGVYSVQGMEAFEAKEVPTTSWMPRNQKSGGLDDHFTTARAETPMFTRWTTGPRKGGHHCLAKAKRVKWVRGSSKLVGELGHGQLCIWVLQLGELETFVWLQREYLAQPGAGDFDARSGYVL